MASTAAAASLHKKPPEAHHMHTPGFHTHYVGQAIGLYGPDQRAGFLGAIVGAVLILFVWGFIERSRRA